MKSCPRCHSPNLKLSRHKGVLDVFAKAFGFLPCRCVECETRFFLPSELAKAAAARRGFSVQPKPLVPQHTSERPK
jgi:hypothetical protein